MARVPRGLTVFPHFAVHKIWRGHNREWNLATTTQKAKYLQFFNEDVESGKYDVGCELNAMCLMSSHTHEIFKIREPKKFSQHMRRHHSKYGIYFNKSNARCGKVAQDRPKTCLIADDEHEMRAVFYIHANPIRAGIVKEASNYPFSTQKLFAFGKREKWMRHIKLPSWYLRLGKTQAQRQKKYRRLFSRYLREINFLRQRFLSHYFYGPTLWMKSKEDSISRWRKAHAPPE